MSCIAAGNAAELQKVAEACKQLGGKVETWPSAPVRKPTAKPSSKRRSSVSAGVDILVVASGFNKVSKIVDQPAADFLEIIDANVTQSWLMARAAGRQMLKQGGGGKVILMSSARGLLGHPAGYSAYCASKSAVDGITKALGCEWGDTGITVNALGPTVFRSPLTQWMFEDNDRARRRCARAFSRACPRGVSASRPISPVRSCSSPRRRPTSTPAISSTPTAATRQAEHGQRLGKARISVIGAGLMGHGIAQVFALAGHDVTHHGCRRGEPRHGEVAHRRQPARPRRGRERGRARAAMRRPCRGGARGRLRRRGGLGGFAAEAEAVRRHRNATCGADTILASNTSVIPITSIMQGLAERERALGTHWWNPPFLVPLVEVIETQWTSPQAVAWTMALHEAAGKKPAHVKKDVPGFIGNRLQHALWREAISLVEHGICDAETVDAVIKASFGRRLPGARPAGKRRPGGHRSHARHPQHRAAGDRQPAAARRPICKSSWPTANSVSNPAKASASGAPDSKPRLRAKVMQHLKSMHDL